MTEIDRILDQCDRAWKGPAWHGPALLQALDGLDAARAARRPIPDAHSLWEIVEHIAAWQRIVRERIEGRPPQVTDEMDWPPVASTTPDDWVRTRTKLEQSHAALRATIAAFPPSKLDDIRPDTESTWYVLIHGIIQHDLYHAGQLALLKKAASA